MTEPTSHNDLRGMLGDLADTVHDVDLHDRAVARSRRIGRNQAILRTGSVLALTGLAGVLFWQVQTPDDGPPTVASSGVVTPSRSGPAPPPSPATTDPSLAVPRSRSLADLPGRVFYQSTQARAVRLSGGRQQTIPTAEDARVAVSPDGTRIAYVTAAGRLYLSGQPEPIFDGRLDLRVQLPAWSPDGTRLLIAAPRPGVLTVADGTFAALPESLAGQHFRWSGDGSKLVYGSTSSCRLKTADADARTGRTVPGLGAPGNAENPEQIGACWVFSVDVRGTRAAVPITGLDGSGADPVAADTVVDTRTGALIPLPVAGQVIGVLFGPDGTMLVRSRSAAARTVLSVFAANGTLSVQAREPEQLRDMDLVGYTR